MLAVPHTLAWPPPPHVWGAAQVPQLTSPPHPSPAGPQLYPRLAHVFGVQLPPSPTPQTLAVPPPPHVAGDAQVPHCRRPPQPSRAGPHARPCAAHVRGTQDP